MGIFDKLTGKHKDTEQEDPDLAQQQQGGQQDYEYSQDMGTAQSTIGQQPQGGYDDPNMGNQGYQDPSMGNQGEYQDPGMGNQGYQDPNQGGYQDPNMSDEDPDEDPNRDEGQQNQGW